MKRALIIVLVVLAGAACLLLFIISRVEIPHNQFIGNWQTKSQTLTLSPLHGHLYALVLGVANAAKPPALDGRILIRKGQTTVFEVAITSTNAKACNWLVDESGCKAGYYIQTDEVLDTVLKPEETYSLDLSSNTGVPDGISVWLCYVQNYFEHRKG
jgi:hypothetical protein